MSRAAMVVALLLLAVATSYFVDTQSSSSPEGIATHTPDLYMINAAITQYGKSGHPHHDIAAIRMNHYPLTNVTTLTAPDMNLYNETGHAPWQIEATEGRMLPEALLREQTVELWDDVVALQARHDGEFISIRTESLKVLPDSDYAETQDKRDIVAKRASERTGVPTSRDNVLITPG
ncbi:MAG: LPS export ABC transporter periplasmic protein LptC, partial [Pseudomonadota bacterium]